MLTNQRLPAFFSSDRARGPRVSLGASAMLLGWIITEIVILDLNGPFQAMGLVLGLMGAALVVSLAPFSPPIPPRKGAIPRDQSES